MKMPEPMVFVTSEDKKATGPSILNRTKLSTFALDTEHSDAVAHIYNLLGEKFTKSAHQHNTRENAKRKGKPLKLKKEVIFLILQNNKEIVDEKAPAGDNTTDQVNDEDITSLLNFLNQAVKYIATQTAQPFLNAVVVCILENSYCCGPKVREALCLLDASDIYTDAADTEGTKRFDHLAKENVFTTFFSHNAPATADGNDIVNLTTDYAKYLEKVHMQHLLTKEIHTTDPIEDKLNSIIENLTKNLHLTSTLDRSEVVNTLSDDADFLSVVNRLTNFV